MRPKRLEFTSIVPRSLEETWDFFSRPENLEKLTPEDVSFNILSPVEGVKMYEGMIIQYTIAPLLNIPMNWVTEITHIKDKEYFIDEQRFGPYAFWHHQHHFKAVDGGTEMKDILHYKVPIPIIGDIADAILVDKQVEQIFSYRTKVIKELFGLL